MKKEIHPESYRLVAFKDMSNDDIFITKSTVETKETIEVDGVEYPLVKLEISRTSHPTTQVNLNLLTQPDVLISLKTNTLSSKNNIATSKNLPLRRFFFL